MDYYVQVIAGNYLKNMNVEPKTMTIHPRFLFGIDKVEFQEGFHALWQLVCRLYTEIAQEPSAFGMLLKENTVANAKNSNYTRSNASFVRVPNLLFAMGAVGTLQPDMTLVLEGEKLLSAAKGLKITALPFLLKQLSNYGFELAGEITDGAIVSVSYPDNRFLPAALKAMADAQLRLNRGDIKKLKNYFYMLHSGLLEKETVKAPKLTFDMVLRTLDDERRKTAAVLHETISAKSKAGIRMGGFMRNDWSCVYTARKSKKVIMSLNTEQDGLSAKLNLQHIGKYINTVMTYPEHIRQVIQSSGWECGHCHDSCAGGFAFEMEGRAYNKCRCGAFLFNEITAEQLPFCQELLIKELAYEGE
jgi:hypothetical protein